MNRGKHSRREPKSKEVFSSVNNGKASRPRTPESSEDSDFAFPILKAIDKGRNLHCYSAVLSRSEDKAVTMEDLVRLQPELEMLLSSVVVRQRTLQAELDALNSPDENRRTTFNNELKRRKLNDGRQSLKELVKAAKEDPKVDGTASSENESGYSADVINETSAPKDVPKLPENDMPNKFWASVETYCGEITQENIKLLEEMISNCNSDMSGVKIPPLGEHYTVKWAKEDLMEEKDASNIDRPKRRPGEVSPDTKNLLKQANNISGKEKVAGPLVQRLVSSLMEENVNLPLQDSYMNHKFEEDFSKIPYTSLTFERRLRKELEAVGLLDPHSEDSDQIYDDLKKCEEELKIVANRNKEYLSKILRQAEKEMARQGIRAKIKTIDAEILEIYKRVNSAKSKQRQLRKKEKELAWRALKEREALLKNLQVL